MKVKVCGLTTPEQVKTCLKYDADFCGLILNYPKSHRHISYEKSEELINLKNDHTKFVGVLVNPSNNELEKFSKLNLDYFQIYGDYNDESISIIKKKTKKKIITALQIKTKKDILNYKKVCNSSDIILLDSSGLEKSISWNYEWIKLIPDNICKMLAGNINIDQLKSVFPLTDIVDVSGALETNKVKDINKIKQFLEKVKKINYEN